MYMPMALLAGQRELSSFAEKEWLKGEKLPGLFQGEVQDALILNWINAAACPGL